jgi:hypothetical protein
MAQWRIIIPRGATFDQTITITGESDIANATAWRFVFALPNNAPFLTATTANGLVVAGATANTKRLVLPPATTSTLPLGNGRFDFEVEWAGGVIRRYASGLQMQVIPKTGEV